MQLITHTTGRTVGQHAKDFEFEGGFVFERMKIAPRSVELTRHTQHGHPQGASIAHGDGKV